MGGCFFYYEKGRGKGKGTRSLIWKGLAYYSPLGSNIWITHTLKETQTHTNTHWKRHTHTHKRYKYLSSWCCFFGDFYLHFAFFIPLSALKRRTRSMYGSCPLSLFVCLSILSSPKKLTSETLFGLFLTSDIGYCFSRDTKPIEIVAKRHILRKPKLCGKKQLQSTYAHK